jgi:hypothetical protein
MQFFKSQNANTYRLMILRLFFWDIASKIANKEQGIDIGSIVSFLHPKLEKGSEKYARAAMKHEDILN